MKIDLLDTLRKKNPIAFNISNFVTVQDVANGINALGASPIMSEEKNEAEPMVQMPTQSQLIWGPLPRVNSSRSVLSLRLPTNTRNQSLLIPWLLGRLITGKNVVTNCLIKLMWQSFVVMPAKLRPLRMLIGTPRELMPVRVAVTSKKSPRS